MKNNIIIAVVVLFAWACTNNKPGSGTADNNTISVVQDTLAVAATDETDGMEIFTNKEQIEYCLPLPLNEYEEVFEKDDVKLRRTFRHKIKKENKIIVEGLFRSDTAVAIEAYFNNTYANAEEEGMIIEQKKLLKNNHCFYATGYWSNFIHEYRFTEICWLRKDEVVKLYSTYDVNDSTLWNARRDYLIKQSSFCN